MNLYSSIRVQVHDDVAMVREIDGDISRVPVYFATNVQTIKEGQDLDMVANLNAQLDNWCGHGSGFVLERITRFVISITK